MSEDVVAVLVRAKERIVERGWCQNTLESHDGRLCLMGALGEPEDLATSRAWECVECVTTEFFELWNDAPGRTEADVLDALDRAIRLAKDAQP